MGRGSQKVEDTKLAIRRKARCPEDLIGYPHPDPLSTQVFFRESGKDFQEILRENKAEALIPDYWFENLDSWIDDSTGYRLAIPPRTLWTPSDSENPYRTRQGNIMVVAAIKNGKKEVGDINLSISLAADEEAEVEIVQLDIDANSRQNGLGKRLEQKIVDLSKRSGATRISLKTSDIGGYFWATRGYDFDLRGPDKDRASATWFLVKQMLRNPYIIDNIESDAPEQPVEGISPETLGRLKDSLKSSWEAGNIKNPADLAYFGSDTRFRFRNQDFWFGKLALLHANWSGIKFL